MLRNTQERYGAVAKLLHWSMAVLIVGLIGLGWYMVGLTYYDPLYHDSLTWHRSLGLIAFALIVLRLAWMAVGRKPRPAASLRPFERWASAAVHWALIVLMVVMPVSGYVISTSAGDPVMVFDRFAVPALFHTGDALRDWAIAIHFYAVYAAAVLVALHAAAAIKHHVIDRDDVLRRMV